MTADLIVGVITCSILSILSLVMCIYETIVHKGEYWLVYVEPILSILLWLAVIFVG